MEIVSINITEAPEVVTIKVIVGDKTPATVVDDGHIHKILPGEIYNCAYGPPENGIIHNSDNSFSETVPSGESVLLEDVTLTDGDGTQRQVPACKNIIATPFPPIPDAQVQNSDESYDVAFTPPGPLSLPDIHFTDSDGHVSAVPACKDIVATPIPDDKSMYFGFPIGNDDVNTITADDDQATTWQSATSDNVTSVVYEKNGAVANLPITLAIGDTLKVTITRNDAGVAAHLKLVN